MSKSCKPILVDNTPCNCVTAATSAGLYGVASPLYPTTASLNALHTVQYNDRVVMYKRTATGWTEVQNYSLGGSDTDTRIEFNQVLPSGEWEWNIRDIVANTILSTFTTPAIIATTVSSPTGSVDVTLNGNNYELEVDVNLPVFSTYTAAFAALGAGKKFRYSTTNTEGVPSPNNSTLAFT